MKKKFVSTILIISILSTGLLSGCGKSASAESVDLTSVSMDTIKEKAKEEGKHYEIDKTPATQLGTINEIIHERNELVWGVALAKNQTVDHRPYARGHYRTD